MKPENNANSHSPYRPDIDGLRAFAILSVLGFHAFPAWVPGGFIGVDVFFVISGFLISGILLSDLRSGQFSLTHFYARRIRRIFPALIAVLIASLGFGYLILWPEEYKRLAKHAAGGAGFIVNVMLQQEAGYFDQQAETKPLLHLWSLGVEEQFYIFWPLMLWVGWKIKRHTGLAISVVLALSFAINLELACHDKVMDFYSLLSRFWELLAGGALAWGTQNNIWRQPSRVLSETLSLIGLVMILSADFALDKNMSFPSWAALLPVCGAASLIAAGGDTFIGRKIMAHPCAVGIGLISYPLYLWHWPLLSYAQIINGDEPSRSVRMAMIALAILAATLTYKFIEVPIRKRKRDQRTIVILVVMMALLGSLSAALFFTNAPIGRFADQEETARLLDNAKLFKNWEDNVRQDICHLQDPSKTEQAPLCIEKTRPLLVLWGDSHAATLYPGLKDLQATHPFGLVQLTQSGCPPILDIPKAVFRPNCNEVNRRILRQVSELKPDVILLAAAWKHQDYPMEASEILSGLTTTLASIKNVAPKAKIIVIGPAPRWTSTLPSIYRRSLTFTSAPPPVRLSKFLDPDLFVLDQSIEMKMSEMKITYLAPRPILCDAGGCLTRLGKGYDTLTYMDEGHLSKAGSEFVVKAFAPELLAALGLAN